MTDIFVTIVVDSTNVQSAKDAASQFTGGDGMFSTGVSTSGESPATHYVSSGWIPEEIVSALTMCTVYYEDPFSTLEALGLKLVQESC